MHRSLALAAPLVALVAGCAARPAPPAVQPGDDPRSAPLAVDYRVTSGADSVLLAGTMAVVPARSAVVEQHAAQSAASEELVIDARPRDDGTVVVNVHYRETAGDGARVSWSPTLAVKRGASATARVEWAGGGRALSLAIR